MPVTPLASPDSPKNRAGISPSFMLTPASTDDHPPKPTCSATSKSRRHQSIRWSSRSNKPASSEDSRDSQGASGFSLLPKTCPSYDDTNSNRQNLCVMPLVKTGRLRQFQPRAQPISGEVTRCISLLSLPLLANNGLPGHVAGTSALPLTADIRVPKSAFWRNTSASPPAADLPGGVAEGPSLTQSGLST